MANSVYSVMTAIRNLLRTNLTDPRTYLGDNARTWIHTDMPRADATFPRIGMRKFDNPLEILTIGQNYWEQEMLFVRIFFYTQRGFKVNIDGIDYKDEELIEYYLNEIKTTLKDQFAANNFPTGVTGYKATNTSEPFYDPDVKAFGGYIIVRTWWCQT